MKCAPRYATLFLSLFCLTAISFGQQPAATDDGATAALAGSSPGYARVKPRAMNSAKSAQLAPVTSATVLDFPANAASSRMIFAAGNSGRGDGSASAPARVSQSNSERDNG